MTHDETMQPYKFTIDTTSAGQHFWIRFGRNWDEAFRSCVEDAKREFPMQDVRVTGKPLTEVKSALLFPNGNMAVFNEANEQIPEPQRKTAKDFIAGDRVEYINWDGTAEPGTVSSTNDKYVFVRFDKQVNKLGWDGATSQSCNPNDLRVTNPTPPAGTNLREKKGKYMNQQLHDIAKQRIIGLKGAVESFEMFDSLGNCAAGALFDEGTDRDGKRVFTAWTWDFNSTTPHCFKGSLGLCKFRLQVFFEAKERAGFECATELSPAATIN